MFEMVDGQSPTTRVPPLDTRVESLAGPLGDADTLNLTSLTSYFGRKGSPRSVPVTSNWWYSHLSVGAGDLYPSISHPHAFLYSPRENKRSLPPHHHTTTPVSPPSPQSTGPKTRTVQ